MKFLQHFRRSWVLLRVTGTFQSLMPRLDRSQKLPPCRRMQWAGDRASCSPLAGPSSVLHCSVSSLCPGKLAFTACIQIACPGLSSPLSSSWAWPMGSLSKILDGERRKRWECFLSMSCLTLCPGCGGVLSGFHSLQAALFHASSFNWAPVEMLLLLLSLHFYW